MTSFSAEMSLLLGVWWMYNFFHRYTGASIVAASMDARSNDIINNVHARWTVNYIHGWRSTDRRGFTLVMTRLPWRQRRGISSKNVSHGGRGHTSRKILTRLPWRQSRGISPMTRLPWRQRSYISPLTRLSWRQSRGILPMTSLPWRQRQCISQMTLTIRSIVLPNVRELLPSTRNRRTPTWLDSSTKKTTWWITALEWILRSVERYTSGACSERFSVPYCGFVCVLDAYI